jgi:hypothetical protein
VLLRVRVCVCCTVDVYAVRYVCVLFSSFWNEYLMREESLKAWKVCVKNFFGQPQTHSSVMRIVSVFETREEMVVFVVYENLCAMCCTSDRYSSLRMVKYVIVVALAKPAVCICSFQI